MDHPKVRRVLPVDDGNHPDPGAPPPLKICCTLLHVVRTREVKGVAVKLDFGFVFH